MEKFDGKKWLIYSVVALCCVWLLICASSCNTSKFDSKRIAKIAQRNPQIIAKNCKKEYPCITVKSDTIRDSIDNIIFVECDSIIRTDSLIEYVPVKVIKKVNVPSETIIVTKTIKDSAEIYLFKDSISDLNKQLKDAQIRINKQSDTIDSQRKIIAHKGKENWIWRILLAILVGGYIWRKAKGST